jgi:hypothetical protein
MSNIQNISRSRKRSRYKYRRSKCLLYPQKLDSNRALFDHCSMRSRNDREAMTWAGWNHWEWESQEIMGWRKCRIYHSEAWRLYRSREARYSRRTQKHDGNSSEYRSNQRKSKYHSRRYDMMVEWSEYHRDRDSRRNDYRIIRTKYECGTFSELHRNDRDCISGRMKENGSRNRLK